MITTPHTLAIDLGPRSYDIVVGEGVLANAGDRIAPIVKDARAFIVTDANVSVHHLHTLETSLDAANVQHKTFVVTPGEATKSFEALEQLLETLLENQPDRHTVLIALGGGVIGDLTGFAASVLLRGVRFIQIPTTLLAQVDSSVGGKTGINSIYGKNLIGSFHQPSLVLADTGAIASLPERERKAGYAEIVKYGLIGDLDFFAWLEQHGKDVIAGDQDALARAVVKSCEAKACIVAADETEKGQRALLNFGHTFGHALEKAFEYNSTLLHGEAVAIGMVLACELSEDLGYLEQGSAQRVQDHFKNLDIPSSCADIPLKTPAHTLLETMRGDKKAHHGTLTLILLKSLGEAFILKNAPEDAVLKRLQIATKAV